MVLFALASALFLAMMHGCWAEGKDLLQPGDETVKATFGKDSSIMNWLLIGEVVTGIVAYVATKNIKVLLGLSYCLYLLTLHLLLLDKGDYGVGR